MAITVYKKQPSNDGYVSRVYVPEVLAPLVPNLDADRTLPEGEFFAGRVLKIESRTVQIMSDMWATECFATIVLDNLTTAELCQQTNTAFTVDITPDRKAAYEAHQGHIAVLSAQRYRAAAILKQVTPVVAKGKPALVFKGRKIKPGTVVNVFWTATRKNKFNGCMEDVAGVFLPNGDKVFCNAENLEAQPTKEELNRFAEAQREFTEAEQDYVDAVKGVTKVTIHPDNQDEANLANREAAEYRTNLPASIIAREAIRSVYGDDVADSCYQRSVSVGDG